MKKKTCLKLTMGFGIVFALLAVNHFIFKLTPMTLRDWMLSFGILAPIVYLLLNIIRPLTLFPISVLSLAGGLAFGTLWGTVYTVFSSTAGAIISFYLSKNHGAHWLKKKISSTDRIEKWQNEIREKGFYYVFILRIIPIINFDLVSYVSGISRLKLKPYIFATLLGVLPGTLAANVLGNSLISGNGMMIAAAAVLLIAAVILAIYLKNKTIAPEPYQKEDNA
ncbi:TVP38/TMEM64 family protein [Fictibacillus barbaricus]|uniref:TVP38/TMEM64 family membrane protein n=1 Tax=Fictibacillus barbaricus TaxID=182136 RepID=A0ABU1U0W3_9BACL|nr:TVP38/TMEM64 family protein [Fictibacillus barbaricus]MDR7073095.1 putative membrane protein YdjX (TVP38/TMEM64 family) [Fictibacillus barbaricus]